MIFLDDEYNRIFEEMGTIRKRLNELEEDKKIQEFLRLKRDYEILSKEKNRIYKVMKYEEYERCQHILVYTKITKDVRGRIQKSCGCIKCGLDDRVLHNKTSEVFYDQKVMYDFLKEKSPWGVQGKDSGYACSLPLARAIYSRIKEVHPDIDDKTALKYFEIALDNIRKIPVSKNREFKRAVRLSLCGQFNKWYEQDVIKEQ